MTEQKFPEKKSSRRELTPQEKELTDWHFKQMNGELRGQLSDSEARLVSSMEDQYEKDGRLSDKQLKLLADVYRRAEKREDDGGGFSYDDLPF